MKLGFIFDSNFKYYKGHYYSINLNQELWNERYLKVFDEILVIGRETEVEFDPSDNYAQSDNDVVKFKCLKSTSRIKRIFNQEQEEKFIAEAIDDCDVVICRGFWGVNACKKKNKKYCIEVITDIWDAMWNHSLLGKLICIPAYLLQRKAIYNAPFVMYVTEQYLQQAYPTKGKQIGVSDVMLPELDESVLRARLEKIKAVDDKIVLGTAASIATKYKGQRFVIEAISYLKKQGMNNYVYELAGSGDNTRLMTLAKELGVEDKIFFKGQVKHDELIRWMDHIDVYIQPSLQEGLPRAVVEAMSRALPCIGTNTGGIPELIESCYICDKTKNLGQEIASVLLKLNKTTMENMAARNFNIAKNFERNRLNNLRVEFLKNIITS